MDGILIVGGGIAGTVLAGALAAAGIPVRVLERRSDAGAGAFLFLDTTAHQILENLGIDRETLWDSSRPVVQLSYRSAGHEATVCSSRGHRLWLREDLMRILTHFATAAGAEINNASTVLDIDARADGGSVTVNVNGRSIAHRGLVVAADGIDSVVRGVLEPNRVPEYTGQLALYGSTTRAVEPSTLSSYLHFYSERVSSEGYLTDALGHIWYDDVTYWFARITQPELSRDDTGLHQVDSWAAHILRAFPGERNLCDELLGASQEVHVTNTRNVTLDGARSPMVPVLLVGDADHAIAPAAGVGARLALQDVAETHRAVIDGASVYEAMALRRKAILAEHARSGRIYRVEPMHLIRSEA